MRQLFLILLLLLGCVATATAAPGQAGHTYAVVFEVSTDAYTQVAAFKVAKVIDPATGSTDAADVDVPDDFIAAARARFASEGERPASAHFYTYYFFDPGHVGPVDPPPPRPR